MDFTYNAERNIYQLRKGKPQGGGDLLILATQEYINRRISPGEIKEEAQKNEIIRKFLDDITRESTKEQMTRYKINPGLEVILLADTEEGSINLKNYLEEMFGKTKEEQ